MLETLYQQHILEHAKHPHNKGALKEPCTILRANNPSCGDTLTLYLRCVDNVITDVSFVGDGCAISQASASLLTEKIEGMSLAEARALGESEVLALLGVPISEGRKKCALLILDALQGMK